MELSIIIPSRSEMFLKNTIEDIIKHREAETEVIAILDGKWAEPSVTQHEGVNIIYVPESIGQREAADIGARLANGKYIMKCDAHCSFEQGFDKKMIELFQEVGDNITAVPVMRNLHAFDWECENRHSRYQSPSGPCVLCGKETVRKMVWQPRRGIHSTSYSFDAEPHFQYFEDWKHRPQYIQDKNDKGYTETMSLQGSCFMMTKEKYWELLGGLGLGNWGNQGLEVACATWLTGGKVLVNHKTWYAHMFRTQGGDFGFPYEQSGKAVQKTKNAVKELFWEQKHPKQIHQVSWLVEKFWPVTGWTDENLKKLKEDEKK